MQDVAEESVHGYKEHDGILLGEEEGELGREGGREGGRERTDERDEKGRGDEGSRER